MNQFCYLLTISLTILAIGNGEFHPLLRGMQQLSIRCDNLEQLSFVRSYYGNPSMDFLKFTRILNEPIDVLVVSNELSTFKSALASININYTVVIENVEEAVHAEVLQNELAREQYRSLHKDKPISYFPRYSEIEDYLTNLAAKYDEIVKFEKIGYSFEKRFMYVLKVSSGGKNKPIILIDAGIHAREWLAPSTALYSIHQLVTNKSNAYMYENVDWYFIPSLNPDGYEYSHTTYRLWRKTRSRSSGSPCIGADANRNFALKWMTVGASDQPCSDIYAGRAPFSEPETKTVRDLVLASAGAIKVYLTLHSYGQYLLHPWGFTPKLPENEPELRKIGKKAADAIAAKFGTNYVVGSSTLVLYAAAGGSDDWLMGEGGADLSYTIELPGGRFDPSPSRIEPVGIETFESLRVFQQFVEEKYAKN